MWLSFAATEAPHDVAGFLLELGAIVLALAILGRVSGRLGLSPIPLYLLVGLAAGEGGLIPLVTAEEFISVGAEIGVVLLLLMLGLEYSADELVENMRASAPAGVLDLLLNGLPGFLAGILLGWGPLAAFVLAGVTYISSSGIIAKVLSDLDRVGNRETSTVLSILVFEDLAMAVYLPLLAGLLVGGGLVALGASLALAMGAVAVVLVVALRFGASLSRLLFSRSDEVLLLSILGLTLLVAGLAAQVQASAAVGAFLVGIGISGPAAIGVRPLLLPLRDLFAGVFFVFFGLQVDPGAIPGVALVATLLAILTGVTKVYTGWWAGQRAGVATRGRFRAGTALVCRGEFSIVIASIGVAGGLEPELGPVAAAYVLVLAIVGPVLTRYSDPLVNRFTTLRRSAPSAPTR